MTTESTSPPTSDLNIAIYKHLLENGLKKTAKKLIKEAKLIIGQGEDNQYILTINKKRHLSDDPKGSSKKQKKELPQNESAKNEEKPVEEQRINCKEVDHQKKFFQRVDPGTVEFLDERLRTNDYLKSNSSSYGERAYKDLSSSRGSDFKKEKNKKKKSTYSGGQIDTTRVHSIKFNDD